MYSGGARSANWGLLGWVSMILVLPMLGVAQYVPPATPPGPSNNLLRPKPNEPLPIPPLPTTLAPSGGSQTAGISARVIYPIPLNVKQVYQLIEPAADWAKRDTLFGAVIFEVMVDVNGAVKTHRLLRFAHPELVEPFRKAVSEMRFAPETSNDVAREGRTKVALVWPRPEAQAASALDSTVADLEAAPINLDQVREMVGYPNRARAERIQGRVAVRVLVNEYGTYVRHRVLSSPNAVLTEAVEEWIYLIRFAPAFRNRKPVRSWIAIPFEFKPI
jgi:TonB family protein